MTKLSSRADLEAALAGSGSGSELLDWIGEHLITAGSEDYLNALRVLEHGVVRRLLQEISELSWGLTLQPGDYLGADTPAPRLFRRTYKFVPQSGARVERGGRAAGPARSGTAIAPDAEDVLLPFTTSTALLGSDIGSLPVGSVIDPDPSDDDLGRIGSARIIREEESCQR